MRYIIAIRCDIPVVAVKSAEWVTAGTGGTAALLHCGIGHSPGEHEALAQNDEPPVSRFSSCEEQHMRSNVLDVRAATGIFIEKEAGGVERRDARTVPQFGLRNRSSNK